MDILDIIFNFSFAFSVAVAIGFIFWQYRVYLENLKSLDILGHFFSKKEAYATLERISGDPNSKQKNSIVLKDVSEHDAELHNLIRDINEYIEKSKGTVAFSIIQNKTERRISMLYEIATSKLSFPTQIGLMGTFAGVLLGLIMFLIGTKRFGQITDDAINSLIFGVLVSMATSCLGIFLLIKSHSKSSKITNQIDRDKNEFYEWVQNELMPSVDVSMVEAIGKLHETIGQFEPTFSGVINKFKDAFRDVTGAFGDDFRLSVQIVKESVDQMGDNIDKINHNIDLQTELLGTIRSKELITGMDAFVEASKKFGEITGSLDQFERARRLMLIAAQEAINIQRDYNESLQIPKQVAADINSILNRIANFEKNIEGLGANIAQTQLVGSKLVEQIRENIVAIQDKQKVAEYMAEITNEKLDNFFNEQKDVLSKISVRYNTALSNYLNDYEQMLGKLKKEYEERKQEFVVAIDKKLSIDDIKNEFTNLRKLGVIVDKLDKLCNAGVKPERLSHELNSIKDELIALNEKQSNVNKGITLFGGGGNGTSEANRHEINRLNDKIITQNEEIEKLKGEIVTLKEKRVQTSSNINAEARNTINRLEGEVSSLKGSINGLKNELNYAQIQLASYQRQSNPMYSTTSTSSVEPSNIAGIQTNDVRIDVHNSEKEVTKDINQNVDNGASSIDLMSEQAQTEESNLTEKQSEKPKSFIQRIFSWKK